MNIIQKIFPWFRAKQSNISEHPDLLRKKSAQNLAEDYNYKYCRVQVLEDYNNTESDIIDIEKQIDNLIRKLSLIKDSMSIEEYLKERNYIENIKKGRKKRKYEIRKCNTKILWPKHGS